MLVKRVIVKFDQQKEVGILYVGWAFISKEVLETSQILLYSWALFGQEVGFAYGLFKQICVHFPILHLEYATKQSNDTIGLVLSSLSASDYQMTSHHMLVWLWKV